jgi:hypothetical protein
MADEEIVDDDTETVADEETVKNPKDGDEDEGDDEALELPDDPEELKKLNAKLYARAKTAEGFVKDKATGKWVKKPAAAPAPKPKPKPDDEEQPNSPAAESTDPVELAELANALRGLSKEEVSFAKTISKGNGITLLEALDTDGFKAFHKEKEAARKKAKAKLGGTSGSGQGDEDKPIVESGMKREDHKALAMKHMG